MSMVQTSRDLGLQKRSHSHLVKYEASITMPILIEESIPQACVRLASMIIAAGILAFVVWASFAKVHEVSRASGAITPNGLERVVQHLEGGIVQDVLVEPGDTVEAGQPLFLLTDASTAEDVSTLSTQSDDLKAQIEVLNALVQDREPDLQFLGPGQTDVLQTNLSAFMTERTARDARLQLLDSQIMQAQSSRAAISQQINGLNDELAYAQTERDRIAALAAQEYATQSFLAERTNAVTKINNQIGVLRERLQLASSNLDEARQNLATFKAENQADLARRIQQLRNAFSATVGETSKEQRRQARLQVLAPTKGIVKDVDVTTIGAVVDSGQPLATIVPVGEELYAEARVPVDQIGYLSVGLPAQVKVSAYDFTRFGWIDGKVTSISPSAFREDGLAPYYLLRIRLDDDAPSNAPEARILPGMEVAADIITGEKTIIEYLLSPVRKALGSSFAER